ncbi:MAG: AMP-binding protein [Polyangiaceae bacterium]|nr:AMP-binding protein [Polyangiaceae bacterium]
MSVEPSNGAVSQPRPALPPLLPSRVLRGRRFVVVGGTGFLGKVWLAMLLDRFPEIEHMHLLVRPKKDQNPEERFWAHIATSPVFDPLRAKYPGTAFEEFLRSKITPIAGDVVMKDLGLPESLIKDLTGRTDAVVNVAGVVDFNPPLDEALEVNAFGVNNLVSLARRLDAKVMHTSTCYVAGYRSGLIEEDDPRDVPFPRSKGETWFGASSPWRTLDRSHWDPQREIDECLDLVKQARQRCEDAFRQSAFLDLAKENLKQRGEPCRGSALDDELAKVKRKFVENQLTEAGRERAQFWGWTNIYTYTKSIGEQVLATSGVPFTIVRPAVVESSIEFPFPGWNEGINTSAPILYMATRGQIQFPGDPNVHLDIIPVDMVCAGMIASLAELIEGTQKPVYQYGTTDTNPASMTRFLEITGLYKRKLVYEGKKTALFDRIQAYFEPQGFTKKQYEQHGAHAIAGAMRGVASVLDRIKFGPLAPLAKPASGALKKAARQEDKLGDVIDMFLPFIAEADWVFSCECTRQAMERMPPEERELFPWYPEKFDWRDYFWRVHIPGLEKWVFPELEERLRKEIAALRPYDSLLDLLDEAAERHDHAVALQRLEVDGLSRTTYREWQTASSAVAARLALLGVKKGDRILLSGKNHPAWPLAYFGILRAGAVAIPIDPDLDGAAMENIARSAGVTVALWDQVAAKNGEASVRRALPSFAAYDLIEFVDAPSSGEQTALTTPKVTVTGTDLASIIYTSGTTGEPKGVMLTHGNFTSLLAALAPIFPLTERDRVLSVLPLHHTFEFTCGMLLPLSRGARILYLDELSAEKLSEGLTKGRVTAMVGVPALWQMLERRIEQRVKERGAAAERVFDFATDLNRTLGQKAGLNLGRVFFGTVHEALGGGPRYLISGGAALPKQTAEFFQGIGLPLAEGYGLTEAAPVLTVASASMKAKPGSVGKAIPNVEIKIENPDAAGVGEILARGPNVMLGYANNSDATSQVLQDGWLRTGDLGKVDKKNRLTIVGRQKDVIVATNGENVYPDDVETLLGKVPHVKELGIAAVSDGQGGDRVGLLAVPERLEGEAAAAETPVARALRHERAMRALREAFQKLPKGSQPSVVHLYDADLPRTATRKVKRKDVAAILARLSAATAAPTAEHHAEGSSHVRHAIASLTHRKANEILPTMTLRGDLGIDSLMAVELQAAVESLVGHAIDTSQLGRVETVEELESLVVASAGSTAAVLDEDEEETEEPIVLPAAVQDAAKRVLTAAQMGFYGKVMQPRVYGRAYIPHNRNTIVVSNHASHLDMGFVKYALGTYGDGLVSLAAQDYFFERDRWTRAYFENFTNLAPFDRKGGLRQALRQAGEILEQGKTVLIFPEGTRSADGSVQEFKSVIGYLALQHDVDILPVYLGGTYEALPKGRSVPTRRDIVARIGPPLEIDELKRLTHGMKHLSASKKIAELAHAAVIALRDGRVLDIRPMQADHVAKATAPTEHPLVRLFRDLEAKFTPGKTDKPLTYYFTLGNGDDAKWTLFVDANSCRAQKGKPEGGQADCVLKTTPEIFTRIVREAYTPSPMEFMTGLVKSNDIGLLQTFQKVFNLS